MRLEPRYTPERNPLSRQKGERRIDKLIRAVMEHGDSDKCLFWDGACNPNGYVTPIPGLPESR